MPLDRPSRARLAHGPLFRATGEGFVLVRSCSPVVPAQTLSYPFHKVRCPTRRDEPVESVSRSSVSFIPPPRPVACLNLSNGTLLVGQRGKRIIGGKAATCWKGEGGANVGGTWAVGVADNQYHRQAERSESRRSLSGRTKSQEVTPSGEACTLAAGTVHPSTSPRLKIERDCAPGDNEDQCRKAALTAAST